MRCIDSLVSGREPRLVRAPRRFRRLQGTLRDVAVVREQTLEALVFRAAARSGRAQRARIGDRGDIAAAQIDERLHVDDDAVNFRRGFGARRLQRTDRNAARGLAFRADAHLREPFLAADRGLHRDLVLGRLRHETQLVARVVHQRPGQRRDDQRHQRDDDGRRGRSHCAARPGAGALCRSSSGNGPPVSGICNASSRAPSARCASAATASALRCAVRVSICVSVSSTRSA